MAGFKNVSVNPSLFQITADYKKATVWGEITITLIPASGSSGQTNIISAIFLGGVLCCLTIAFPPLLILWVLVGCILLGIVNDNTKKKAKNRKHAFKRNR